MFPSIPMLPMWGAMWDAMWGGMLWSIWRQGGGEFWK
jgi:hypothetical protein